MPKKSPNNKMVIYQAKSGAIEIMVDPTSETFLLTQQQVAQIFDVQKAAISKHVKNIFESGELRKKATVSILETVQTEGRRTVTRKVERYNLDLVLSIGYRVNSLKATRFRQWATKTLRAHIVDGYTINRSQIGRNYEAFMQAVEDVRVLLPAHLQNDTGSILELVRLFADTWVSLDAYDREALDLKKPTKKKVALTGASLTESVAVLKQELLKRGEATDIFATERSPRSLEGIVGNVMQAVGGADVYPSIEAKAAHLLYFVVKNHPFIDGNKRTGAYSFVWFLSRAKVLDTKRLTPAALTAITLLIAESNPKDKEKMVRLVMLLIGKR